MARDMDSSKNNNALDEEGKCSESLPPQDVDWLASVSEFELDFLISLKEMAIRRAENVGYMHLIENFDARVLRVLGLIMLEYFKDRVQSTSEYQNSAEALTPLNSCSLATSNQEENLESTSCTKDISTSSCVTPKRKRMRDGLCEERGSRSKKQKTAKTDN